jgi:2-polyprenyl-6-methoxyphenol hydroxylase-like FAD-dependent oxidoreductase
MKESRSMQPDAARPPMKPNQHKAPHIVVVGGGVAGLILATRLGHLLGRRGLARVSLIDRSWIHVWKPMLHTFVVKIGTRLHGHCPTKARIARRGLSLGARTRRQARASGAPLRG